jgi:hypothetical protein
MVAVAWQRARTTQAPDGKKREGKKAAVCEEREQAGRKEGRREEKKEERKEGTKGREQKEGTNEGRNEQTNEREAEGKSG